MPNEYDCFILCSASRFHDTDFKLAQKIYQECKNIYFVHLKFDQDIEGRENKSERPLTEEEIKSLMEEIKEDIQVKMVGIKLRRPIFVVSALMVKF